MPRISEIAASFALISAVSVLYFWRRAWKLQNELNFLIVGDTFVDIVVGSIEYLPIWGGDTLVSNPIQTILGGSGANLAAHVAESMRGKIFNDVQRRKHVCRLFTAVGKDQYGMYVRSQLKARGVQLDNSLRNIEGAQGVCVVVSGKEDRCFMTHRGVTDQFDSSKFQLGSLSPDAHLHIGGYYNMSALMKDVPQILKEAKSAGASTSLTPQYDATECWGGLDEAYPYLTFLILNEIESAKLSGFTDRDLAGKYFLEQGVEHVIITAGSDGAYAFYMKSSQICVLHQESKKVPVVDTTGAGDAFTAGFLYSWKVCSNIDESLQWGCAFGATCVQMIGGSDADCPITKNILKLNMI